MEFHYKAVSFTAELVFNPKTTCVLGETPYDAMSHEMNLLHHCLHTEDYDAWIPGRIAPYVLHPNWCLVYITSSVTIPFYIFPSLNVTYLGLHFKLVQV
jgi:hypothetical protein